MTTRKGELLPSGYTAAWGQQTQATQAKVSGRRGGLRSAAKRRKARAASTTHSTKRKARRASAGRSKRGKLVKGSAAAKAWGRKMRRARKR